MDLLCVAWHCEMMRARCEAVTRGQRDTLPLKASPSLINVHYYVTVRVTDELPFYTKSPTVLTRSLGSSCRGLVPRSVIEWSIQGETDSRGKSLCYKENSNDEVKWWRNKKVVLCTMLPSWLMLYFSLRLRPMTARPRLNPAHYTIYVKLILFVFEAVNGFKPSHRLECQNE